MAHGLQSPPSSPQNPPEGFELGGCLALFALNGSSVAHTHTPRQHVSFPIVSSSQKTKYHVIFDPNEVLMPNYPTSVRTFVHIPTSQPKDPNMLGRYLKPHMSHTGSLKAFGTEGLSQGQGSKSLRPRDRGSAWPRCRHMPTAPSPPARTRLLHLKLPPRQPQGRTEKH